MNIINIGQVNDGWLARLSSEYHSDNFAPDPRPTQVGLMKYLLKHISVSAQEPLSEIEIMQIVNANEGDTIGVVRAIEKAHGIGV